MDYYQGVVVEYLRANRATFVNTEFFAQTVEGKEPPRGTSWYIDVLAVNFEYKIAQICEITYSASKSALLKKLFVWSDMWPQLVAAIQRDAHLPVDWCVELWLFVPKDKKEEFRKKLPEKFKGATIVELEETVPWKHDNFRREEKRLQLIALEKALE